MKAKAIFAPMAPEPIGSESESDVAFAFARSALALTPSFLIAVFLGCNLRFAGNFFMLRLDNTPTKREVDQTVLI